MKIVGKDDEEVLVPESDYHYEKLFLAIIWIVGVVLKCMVIDNDYDIII